MEKFIIEKEDKEAVYLMYADEDGDVMVEGAYLTPYIEPDREKAAADAFQRGYEHAKHECEDCRKIRAGAEQELADNAYQRGLNDAWEAARKICTNWVLPDSVLSEIFGMDKTIDDIMKETTASEAIEKIRQYEQERQFHVGDEIETQNGFKGFVIRADDKYVYFVDENGEGCVETMMAAKTGRHFPEIAEVLKKMRENE